MQCDCSRRFAFFFLGRVFKETLSVFTALPYHSVVLLCMMTALYTDKRASGFGLLGFQRSFSVWKSQLSPSTDGVHHSEIQHGILNLSVMCIFLKTQSIQWQWRWWKGVVDWEVYLVILCTKSHRSCSSSVNSVSWKGRKQGKRPPMGFAHDGAMQCESMRSLWAAIITPLSWWFEQLWPSILLSFCLPCT